MEDNREGWEAMSQNMAAFLKLVNVQLTALRRLRKEGREGRMEGRREGKREGGREGKNEGRRERVWSERSKRRAHGRPSLLLPKSKLKEKKQEGGKKGSVEIEDSGTFTGSDEGLTSVRLVVRDMMVREGLRRGEGGEGGEGVEGVTGGDEVRGAYEVGRTGGPLQARLCQCGCLRSISSLRNLRGTAREDQHGAGGEALKLLAEREDWEGRKVVLCLRGGQVMALHWKQGEGGRGSGEGERRGGGIHTSKDGTVVIPVPCP